MEGLKKLEARFQSTMDALSCLKQALNFLAEESDKNKAIHMRNSAIHCFEFSFDTFWKYLKDYAFLIHNVTIKPTTPNKTFRESYNLDMTTEQELENLFEFTTLRNQTSHTYNEATAKNVIKKMPLAYKTMHNILVRLAPSEKTDTQG